MLMGEAAGHAPSCAIDGVKAGTARPTGSPIPVQDVSVPALQAALPRGRVGPGAADRAVPGAGRERLTGPSRPRRPVRSAGVTRLVHLRREVSDRRCLTEGFRRARSASIVAGLRRGATHQDGGRAMATFTRSVSTCLSSAAALSLAATLLVIPNPGMVPAAAAYAPLQAPLRPPVTAAGERLESSALTSTSHVLVYGGTPGGIVAAISAARAGATVRLLEPTSHLGGMMANGSPTPTSVTRRRSAGSRAACSRGSSDARARAPRSSPSSRTSRSGCSSSCSARQASASTTTSDWSDPAAPPSTTGGSAPSR